MESSDYDRKIVRDSKAGKWKSCDKACITLSHDLTYDGWKILVLAVLLLNISSFQDLVAALHGRLHEVLSSSQLLADAHLLVLTLIALQCLINRFSVFNVDY